MGRNSWKPRSGVKNLSVLFADRRRRRVSIADENLKGPSNADYVLLQKNLAEYLRPLQTHPHPIHIPDDLLSRLARKMAKKMNIHSNFSGSSSWLKNFKLTQFGSAKVFSEGREVKKIYDIPMETGILVRQVLFKDHDDHQSERGVRTSDDDYFSSIDTTNDDDAVLSPSIPAITLDELPSSSNSTDPNNNNKSDINCLFNLSPISIVSDAYEEDGIVSCDLIERVLDGDTTDFELDQLLESSSLSEMLTSFFGRGKESSGSDRSRVQMLTKSLKNKSNSISTE